MLLQNFSLAFEVDLVEVANVADFDVDVVEHVQELLVALLDEGAPLQLA